MKFFYSFVFLMAGALFLVYLAQFARNGEMPIRGGTFYRSKDAPAFWLFVSLFLLAGLASIAGAIAILFSDV